MRAINEPVKKMENIISDTETNRYITRLRKHFFRQIFVQFFFPAPWLSHMQAERLILRSFL